MNIHLRKFSYLIYEGVLSYGGQLKAPIDEKIKRVPLKGRGRKPQA